MIHFADTYYLPSWQGGDVQRPRRHRGRLGLNHTSKTKMTEDFGKVTCSACVEAHRAADRQKFSVHNGPLSCLSQGSSDQKQQTIAA